YVRASDEQHQTDTSHEDEQDLAHIAHHVCFKGRTSGPMRACSNTFRLNPGGAGKLLLTMGSMRSTSALAWARVAPGLSLATDRKLKFPTNALLRSCLKGKISAGCV